jgi:hypothetical protein
MIELPQFSLSIGMHRNGADPNCYENGLTVPNQIHFFFFNGSSDGSPLWKGAAAQIAMLKKDLYVETGRIEF